MVGVTNTSPAVSPPTVESLQAVCGTGPTVVDNGAVLTIFCPRDMMEARYVVIAKNTALLSMAEVVVYGYEGYRL